MVKLPEAARPLPSPRTGLLQRPGVQEHEKCAYCGCPTQPQLRAHICRLAPGCHCQKALDPVCSGSTLPSGAHPRVPLPFLSCSEAALGWQAWAHLCPVALYLPGKPDLWHPRKACSNSRCDLYRKRTRWVAAQKAPGHLLGKPVGTSQQPRSLTLSWASDPLLFIS